MAPAVRHHALISIHSLRVEGDQCVARTLSVSGAFQSTPSVWRETAVVGRPPGSHSISIHSLRVEGDCTKCIRRDDSYVISIHSLRVEGD